MVAITAAMVKELRERTGLGMSKCNQALKDTDGDIEKAILLLREQGLKSAGKKKDRAANEGLIAFAESDTGYAMVELYCETDFVAKTEQFRNTLNAFATEAAKAVPANLDAFLSHKMADGSTVQETSDQMIAKLGENIGIARIFAGKKEANHSYGFYAHNEGAMASFVEIEGSADKTDLAKDIALHVVAFSPIYRDESAVPADILEEEKNIARSKNEGKPENVLSYFCLFIVR